MKKIGLVLLALVLSSCWSGGKLNLFEGRNRWIVGMQSQPVTWLDSENRLVRTERVTERGFKRNEVLTAYTGQTIVDAKTFRREYYATEYLRANMDGVLSSSTVPVNIQRNERRRILGSTMMGAEKVFLVQADLDDFVLLIRDNGTFYPRMGQIRDNRMIVLDPTFVPLPSDLRFEPVVTTRVSQNRPVKGFDLKYGGKKLGKMLFTYMRYTSSGSGSFKNLSVAPTETGIVRIRGVKLRVLHADEQRINYMILD
jgi:hypothetical protein